MLAYSGQPKLGVDAIETALRLNPKPTPDTEHYAGIVFFIDGQYQRAEKALSRAVRVRHLSEPVWAFLAASRALLGRKDDAAKAIAGLLNTYPNSSVEYLRARDSYFRHPEDLDKLLAGLSEAGLPQWAFAFQGSKSDRLNAQELRSIVEDKTWIGQHVNGIEFLQQNDRSGTMAYRSKNSIQTGKVSIRQGMLFSKL